MKTFFIITGVLFVSVAVLLILSEAIYRGYPYAKRVHDFVAKLIGKKNG